MTSIALASRALVAVLAAAAVPCTAQEAAAATVRLPELERAFWACDHAGTHGRVDDGTAVRCTVVTETLKQRRFYGDFTALVAWCQQHKETEHAAIAAAGMGQVRRAR